jgi:hypothetical protein
MLDDDDEWLVTSSTTFDFDYSFSTYVRSCSFREIAPKGIYYPKNSTSIVRFLLPVDSSLTGEFDILPLAEENKIEEPRRGRSRENASRSYDVLSTQKLLSNMEAIPSSILKTEPRLSAVTTEILIHHDLDEAKEEELEGRKPGNSTNVDSDSKVRDDSEKDVTNQSRTKPSTKMKVGLRRFLWRKNKVKVHFSSDGKRCEV